MYAKEILRVIYAPQKAFKEIIQNPRYIGPLLIMLLFMITSIGLGYALLSKMYVDQITPQGSTFDEWTEDTSFWTSNANITLNTQDYISGTYDGSYYATYGIYPTLYYGNKSIEFSLASSSQVWLELNISGSLNCLPPNGYDSLSFRLKLIEPSTSPQNVSLYMLSTSPQDTFYHNLTEQLNAIGVWNNLTISIGPESGEWTSNANANWGDITGLRLELTWPTSTSNITLIVDGLFFHGVYKSLADTASGTLFVFPINAFMQFTIQWVIFGGLLFLIPRMFKVKTVWKPLLIIAGFSLVTLFIQRLAIATTFAVMPPVRYPLQVVGGVPGEWEPAYNEVSDSVNVASQVLRLIEIGLYAWTIGLCAIALRLMLEFSWMKSLLISAVAYFGSILLFRFLTYGAIWL